MDAVAGAAALAACEAVAPARQRPGEIRRCGHGSLPRRARSSALVSRDRCRAGRGGAVAGTLGGLLGIRPQKALVGCQPDRQGPSYQPFHGSVLMPSPWARAFRTLGGMSPA
jgi:hypothetical protein